MATRHVVSHVVPCSVLVVLDTNVLVAAIRSRRGASFALLSRLGTGAFDVAVSVPLVLEYEAVLVRHAEAAGLSRTDVEDLIDYICSVARQQHIFYLWRPLARDPKDDMVAELAIASAADAIVTHNLRDFAPVAELGMRVTLPRDFLAEIGA